MTAAALETVRVTPKGAGRIASGHPWVFESDIAGRANAAPGAVVLVADSKGRHLGVAHYSASSKITLRMLDGRVAAVDAAFYRARLQAAFAHRQRVCPGEQAYRLVHAEGDLLPGLIVDRYADVLVVQTLTQGMDAARPLLIPLLEELFSPRSIYVRNDAAVRQMESLPLETGVLAGAPPGRVRFEMNGLWWEADPEGGQKTGIYLDQRENYLAARRHGRGRALDCFTSTGGFALHLAPLCDSVEAVDSSGPALETARANAAANGIGNVQFREADVFDVLAAYAKGRRRFDTIVLDPPPLAKSRGSIDAALRAYKELNLRALKMLDSGGVLVTCSCSHHVGEAALLEVIAEAALDAGRTVRVLERRSQAADHPILLTVPETLYLKCLVLQAL